MSNNLESSSYPSRQEEEYFLGCAHAFLDVMDETYLPAFNKWVENGAPQESPRDIHLSTLFDLYRTLYQAITSTRKILRVSHDGKNSVQIGEDL